MRNEQPRYTPTQDHIKRMCHLIRRTRQFRQRQHDEQILSYGTPVRLSGISDDLRDNRMFAVNLPIGDD